MNVLVGLVLGVGVFLVFNLFMPAGWAAVLGGLTFILVAFGNRLN